MATFCFEFYLNKLRDEVLEIFFAIEIRAEFNLRKIFFKTVKPFFTSCQEIALNEAIFA